MQLHVYTCKQELDDDDARFKHKMTKKVHWIDLVERWN